MTIEVTIEHEEYTRFGENEVVRGQILLNKLRAAGIPVIGILFPLGVETGKLTYETDVFGNLSYTWNG